MNSSYSRRTKDLNKARQRIFQLEAELEDAWKEAERMAKDLDDYENAIDSDDSMAVIETAEIVSVTRTPSQTPPPHLTLERRSSIPMPVTPTLLTFGAVSASLTTPALTFPPQPLKASPVPTVTFLPAAPLEGDADDAASIKSAKSTRSVKSIRSIKSHASSVQAAKKRSYRASQSSLHLRKPSINDDDDLPPPMPEIPLQYVSAVYSAGIRVPPKGLSQDLTYSVPANASSTMLHADGVDVDASGTMPGHFGPTRSQLKKQASLDTLATSGKTGVAAVDAYKGKATDDIFVGRGRNQFNHFVFPAPSLSPYARENAPFLLNLDDDDDDMPFETRTPLYRRKNLTTFVPDYRPSHSLGDDNVSIIPPAPPPKDLSKKIPSMWMNVDAIRTHPLQRPSDSTSPPLSEVRPVGQDLDHDQESPTNKGGPSTNGKMKLMLRHKTIHKFKGLTKRYTVALPPLFNGKPSSRNG